MDLNINGYNIVNFSILGAYGNYVYLGAKWKNETFFVWIKPEHPDSELPEMWQDLGYQWHGDELYLENKKQPTVSLEMALRMFYGFIMMTQRKAILVSHSADFEVMALLRAFQYTGAGDMFRDCIDGFADSLLILRAKLRDRKHLSQFGLTTLAKDLLGKEYSGVVDEVALLLDVLAELTTEIIEPSDFKGFITPYEEALTNETIEEV